MSERMVIEFCEDGTVEAMNQENILPLGFLGLQTISRASELLFDEPSQTWAIHVADGTGGFHDPYTEAQGFATYESARQFEVKWFTECRLADVKPQSPQGHLVLRILRARK